MAVEPSTTTELRASLNYLVPGSESDVDGYYAGTAAILRRQFDARQVPICDLRGGHETFTLDRQGFQLVPLEGRFNDFDDWFATIDQYFPAVVKLVKEYTGATQVLAIQHLVRNETHESALAEADGKADLEQVSKLGPGRVVHVDQSYAGARGYMEEFVGGRDAARLAQTRWAIVNVWKPIETVTRDPLALCDAQSVSEADLRPVTVKKPTHSRKHVRDMETWQLYHRPEHRWYYQSRMTPREAFLIKIFDSKQDGRARRTPHSAFRLPGQLADAPPRRSVEVRCLVFWGDEEAE